MTESDDPERGRLCHRSAMAADTESAPGTEVSGRPFTSPSAGPLVPRVGPEEVVL